MDADVHDFEYLVRRDGGDGYACAVSSFPHITGHGSSPKSALDDAILKVQQELEWWAEQFEPAPLPTHLPPVTKALPGYPAGILGWAKAFSTHTHAGVSFHPCFEQAEPFGDASAYRTLTHFGARLSSSNRELLVLACRDLVFEVRQLTRRPLRLPAGMLLAVRFVEEEQRSGSPYRVSPVTIMDETSPPLPEAPEGHSVAGFIRLPEAITYPPEEDSCSTRIASFTSTQTFSEGGSFRAELEESRRRWQRQNAADKHMTVEVFLYGRQIHRS
jgi:hypothetical protein